MLSRYRINQWHPEHVDGIRQDTRKHTRHILRPPGPLVERFLGDPSLDFGEFRGEYTQTVAERFARDPRRFHDLAELADRHDVYLGCSCTTKRQPDITHCHTWLALEFMRDTFPGLDVRFPAVSVATSPRQGELWPGMGR